MNQDNHDGQERSFEGDIAAMNTMYDLPVNQVPTLVIGQNVAIRLTQFKSILTKELSEINAIIEKASCNLNNLPYSANIGDPTYVPDDLEILTDLADLFADLQVFCASEMVKFGLPINQTLRIVMDSNFSKLGANGLPIKDDEGKFLKGPNYWKPEGMISEMLAHYHAANTVVKLTSVK